MQGILHNKRTPGKFDLIKVDAPTRMYTHFS